MQACAKRGAPQILADQKAPLAVGVCCRTSHPTDFQILAHAWYVLKKSLNKKEKVKEDFKIFSKEFKEWSVFKLECLK